MGVQPLLERAGHAAPVGRAQYQAVGGQQVVSVGFFQAFDDDAGQPRIGDSLGGRQCHRFDGRPLGVVKNEDGQGHWSEPMGLRIGAVPGETAVRTPDLALLLHHMAATNFAGQIVNGLMVQERERTPHTHTPSLVPGVYQARRPAAKRRGDGNCSELMSVPSPRRTGGKVRKGGAPTLTLPRARGRGH